MVPFSSPKPATSSSSEGASTSTMAWPSVTTSELPSMAARVPPPSRLAGSRTARGGLRVTDMAEHRLGGAARPRRYEVELTPDLAASRFDGQEVVTLDVLEPSRELVCHAVELDISEARLETPSGASLAGHVRP